MTAPRPVEPVVGMEFYLCDEPWPYKVTRVTGESFLCTNADPHTHGGSDSFYRDYWTKMQFINEVRPVLWTVGPSAAFNGKHNRLGRYLAQNGKWKWTSIPKDVRGDHHCMRVCAWPTRAAALAAGKAFGWEKPVARRVRRRA